MNNQVNYVKDKTLDQLVNQGKRVFIDHRRSFYTPIFFTAREALSFGQYAEQHVKNMIPDAEIKITTTWSKVERGLKPVLSVRFCSTGDGLLNSHWREEGTIVCKGDQVVGLLLSHTDAPETAVILEVKPLQSVVWTSSGSVYVSFTDGTTFYSAGSGGHNPGKALYFADSQSQATMIMTLGGELAVSDQPARELHPVLVHGELPTQTDNQGVLHFSKGSIYCVGTKIVTMWSG